MERRCIGLSLKAVPHLASSMTTMTNDIDLWLFFTSKSGESVCMAFIACLKRTTQFSLLFVGVIVKLARCRQSHLGVLLNGFGCRTAFTH